MGIATASSTLTDTRAHEGREAIRSRLIQRIETEYVEMPGLTLTGRQAARLLGVDAGHIDQLLSELIERGFLMRDRKGAYRRRGCPRCS